MEKMNDLRDLLRHEIQDLYSAEEQIIAAMPKMINKATDRTLTASLSEHLAITQKQKQRLDRVQQLLGEEAQANGSKKKGLLSGLFSKKHTCKAMQGIIEEGNTILAADMSTEVRDAAIIACAQKIEHYEICGYGTARTYARELGMEKVAQLLEETLNEEYEADDKLTSLAVSRINQEAESGNRGRARSASEGQMRGERTREKTNKSVLEPVAQKTARGSKTGATKNTAAPRNTTAGRATGSSGATRTTDIGTRASTGSTKGSQGNRSSKTN